MNRVASLRSACGCWVALGVLATGLAGCAAPGVPKNPATVPLAPLAIPDAWSSPTAWTPARPADHLDKGHWWQVFNDAQLDQLIAQAQHQHPNVRIAEARLRQAQANQQVARAGALPRVDLSLRPVRQRTSANRPANLPNATVASTVQNDTVLTTGVSYEIDLFNRIGSEIDAAAAGERQLQSDLANTRLVLAADLAASYFTLRQIDAEMAVLAQGIQLQQRAVALLQARYDGGASSGLEVAQQQTLLDATATQLALLERQRPVAEHLLATLSGQPASSFRVAASSFWDPSIPQLPVTLPAQVLQRRPDVAAAQHAIAAATAQIGVVQAGFFPSLVLNTSAGFESRSLGSLLGGPSLLWSLGASLTHAVWDGGRNQGRLAGAQEALEITSASYRRTVLQAVQEVEDGLSSLHALARAADSARTATTSATRALSIAQARYAGGAVTYLEVVSAQQALLNNRRQAAQIHGQQLVTAAYLVKALGGSWQDSTASAH